MAKVLLIITRSELGGAQKHCLELINGLHLEYDFEVIVGSCGYLEQKLGAMNISVHVCPSIDSFNALQAIRSLKRLISDRKPTIVNTHSMLASFYARAACKSYSIPLIYSVHGWSFTGNRNMFKAWACYLLERFAKNWTTHWITETKFDMQVGLDRGVISDAGKCSVVPNGITAPSKKRNLDKPKNQYNLIFVGRNSYQKNPELAIEVLAMLGEKYYLDVYCTPLGLDRINRKIIKQGLENRVNVITDESNTIEIIHNYDALLCTSRYEGMPLAILEAMQEGLPVVAPNICGLSELVVEGETGFLCNSFKAKDYATLLERIFLSRESQRQFSLNSKDRFDTNYKAQTMAAKIGFVYRKHSTPETHNLI